MQKRFAVGPRLNQKSRTRRDKQVISYVRTGCPAIIRRERSAPSLRELLDSSIDLDEWHRRYEDGIDEDDDCEEICINPPSWYIPEDINSSLLFICLRFNLASSVSEYMTLLTEFMVN